jgi:hypothetical protein
VLVAKKDFNAPKHEELDIPNLEVVKALQSLTSRGLRQDPLLVAVVLLRAHA